MIKLAGEASITYNAQMQFTQGTSMLARPIFLSINLLIISLLGISLSPALWADDGLSSSATKQSFYKWIDEKGVTHYSATPPLPKEEAKKIKRIQIDVPVKHTTTEATTTPAPAASTEQPKPPSTSMDARQDLNAKRDQSCQTAKKNLDTLQNQPRIYQTTKEGKRYYLTGPERQEQIQKSQQFLNDHC